ncbi:MAG TPA: MarR family transcriptional regulator [Euzebyales bacterium]|nr:MarR family transcriptional regulator [Euzebyales bacterium]
MGDHDVGGGGGPARQRGGTPAQGAGRAIAGRKEVLFRISLAGGSMRMAELAQALLFTAGGATRIVDRMVRAGLVDRAGSRAIGARPSS